MLVKRETTAAPSGTTSASPSNATLNAAPTGTTPIDPSTQPTKYHWLLFLGLGIGCLAIGLTVLVGMWLRQRKRGREEARGVAKVVEGEVLPVYQRFGGGGFGGVLVEESPPAYKAEVEGEVPTCYAGRERYQERGMIVAGSRRL